MQVRQCDKTEQPTVRACSELPRAPPAHERRESAKQQEDNEQEQHKEQNGNDACAGASKKLTADTTRFVPPETFDLKVAAVMQQVTV